MQGGRGFYSVKSPGHYLVPLVMLPTVGGEDFTTTNTRCSLLMGKPGWLVQYKVTIACECPRLCPLSGCTESGGTVGHDFGKLAC